MPNWCDTTYKAVGTKQQVKKFYDLALRSWNKSDNDNPRWLGHFITELGGDWKEHPCRGWMRDEPYLRDDFDDDYAMCTIYCDTAWGELSEWREYIESQIDGLFILYTAVEPGCGVYITNDDTVANKYHLDSPDYDDDWATETQVINFVNKHYDQSFKTIDECISYQKKVNDTDDWLYINQMELTD